MGINIIINCLVAVICVVVLNRETMQGDTVQTTEPTIADYRLLSISTMSAATPQGERRSLLHISSFAEILSLVQLYLDVMNISFTGAGISHIELSSARDRQDRVLHFFNTIMYKKCLIYVYKIDNRRTKVCLDQNINCDDLFAYVVKYTSYF